MRNRLSLGLILAVLGSVLVVPFAQAAEEACLTRSTTFFHRGDHHRWRVETPENSAGTPAWRTRQESTSRGVTMDTDASGTGTKDDRLVSTPVVATTRTTVIIDHDYLLGPGSGAVLEATVDGREWFDAGELLVEGGYDGTVTIDGVTRDAWTGATTVPLHLDETANVAHVDLSRLAGERVTLRWRLLQQSDTAVPGAYWSLLDVTWNDYVDVDCADGWGDRPWASCSTDVWPGMTPQTATGNSTPTWSQLLPQQLGLWVTSASGLAAKDDRLLAEPVLVTPDSRVTMTHRFLLEEGYDGGLLEFTAGGSPWTAVPEEWFLTGGYNGTLQDGSPAWTGSSATHPDMVRPTPEWLISSAVRLGALAGHEVQLRLRLVQDDVRPGSTPGGEWAMSGFAVRDAGGPDCVPQPPPFDVEPDDCLDAVPDTVSLQGITDDGATLPLRVRVLLHVAEGPEILARAGDLQTDPQFHALVTEMEQLLGPSRDAYERIGVDLDFSWDLLGDRGADGEAIPQPETSQEFIDAGKAHYGGQRPPGVDVVYVATDGTGLEGSVAGRADCLGGIRYPEAAFAMGLLYRHQQSFSLAGFGVLMDTGAKVLTHEVAHLLGAHHHYANCAEGAATQLPRGDLLGPCTVMINDVGLAWLHFSTLEGAVVRGYTAEFAARDG